MSLTNVQVYSKAVRNVERLIALRLYKFVFRRIHMIGRTKRRQALRELVCLAYTEVRHDPGWSLNCPCGFSKYQYD